MTDGAETHSIVGRVRTTGYAAHAVFPERTRVDILAFQAITIVCATAAFVASLRFVRQISRVCGTTVESLYHRRRQNDRLERIEMIVEATAIEVERISEANRFMAKLLAERTGAPTPSSRPERVITPH